MRVGPRAHSLALMVAAVILASDLHAYLKLGVRNAGEVLTARWLALPVRYFVSGEEASGIPAPDFAAAIGRAARAWQEVDTSAVGFEFAGFTGAVPGEDDGVSSLGFVDRPDLERVLGATEFLVDITTGAIVEADIFFNASFPWSVAPAGDAGRFDLESIAVHELGHLVGLGHSAIGETERSGGGRRVLGAGAVMFPIAFAAGNLDGRRLQADDIAGVSDLYPDAGFSRERGSISGRVTLDGRGVVGAHVTAFHLASGRLVGGFTLNQEGEFTIAGLEPGPHVVRVEPLDDADVDSFFEDPSEIETGFGATYLDRLAIVPRGGDAGRVEIKVAPR